MSKRKLRPAVAIASDIGALGFDLQQHSEAEIVAAVALLRTVNAEMFDWLSKVLGKTEPADPPLPEGIV